MIQKSIFILVVIVFFMFSCEHESENTLNPLPTEKGKVSFLVKEPTTAQKSSGKSDAKATLVEISKDGTTVFDGQLELYHFGTELISEPIPLTIGEYTLEKFLVIDADDNIIFASPKGDLSYLVNKPLPFSFEVVKDEELKIIPEVISTDNFTADDLGYASFDFDIKNTVEILITGKKYSIISSGWKATDFYCVIYGDGNNIFSDSINALTDSIVINSDFESYTFVSHKNGYLEMDTTILGSDLESYQNMPLVFLFTKTEPVTDIDGNTYNTVDIEGEFWMAENLMVERYNTGDSILYITNPTDFYRLNGAGFCYYNNDRANKERYGGLYNWYVTESENICPVGWHVPSRDEWLTLRDVLGRDSSGIVLKSTDGWFNSGNGTNETGFNGIPSGATLGIYGFTEEGERAHYLSTTTSSESVIYSASLSYQYNSLGIGNFQGKRQGLSIRCVKDGD